MLKMIKKFLVEASSNVVSVAFKFLSEGRLDNSEAKEYASKNILLNMQSIFRQLMRAIEASEALRIRLNLEELRGELTVELDSILSSIMINLSDSYPMAPPTGGTQRMREVINEVNRTDDE
jgi:hypothetical protein